MSPILKAIFIMAVISMYSQISLGQDPNAGRIDSLINELSEVESDQDSFEIYNQLYRYHYRKDIAQAKIYLDEETRLAIQIGDDEMIIKAKNHLGIFHSISRESEKALKVFTELSEYYEKKKNLDRLAASLHNISTAHLALGNHKKALDYELESLKIADELGTTGTSLANKYFTIGNIYRMIEEEKTSNEWLKKALRIYTEVGRIEYVSQTHFTLGINYLKIDSLDLAYPHLEKAANFFRKANIPNSLSVALLGMGDYAYYKNDYDNALEYFKEGYDLGKNNGDIAREMDALAKLGRTYNKLGRNNKSIQYYKNALVLAQKIENRKFEANIMQALAAIYGEEKSYSKAYQNLNKFWVLQDSISKEDNIAALSELEVKYETEKKEKEIQLLEEQNKRSKLENNVLLGGIISLVALFGAFFYAVRQRMKKNALEKERVKQQLEFQTRELEIKKNELIAYAMQLANKNEVLEDIKSKVIKLEAEANSGRAVQKIINSIDLNQNDNATWEGFRSRFQAIHKDFEQKVIHTYSEISPTELRLMSLLKMGLSSKEIASILNITPNGVKKARYRLRKKLNLQTNDSLEELVYSI